MRHLSPAVESNLYRENRLAWKFYMLVKHSESDSDKHEEDALIGVAEAVQSAMPQGIRDLIKIAYREDRVANQT